MKTDWEKVLLFKSNLSRGDILTSVWSLQMVSCTWFYFTILFIYFEVRDRWSQFSIEDVDDPEDGGTTSSVESGPRGDREKVKRWYTVRLRGDTLDPKYMDLSATIHVKFYFLKEKLAQFILPVCSLRKHGQIYTNPQGSKYVVILIHWHTPANLTNCDEIRIAHSGVPQSPEIFLRDLDVREPGLKIRIHCPINRPIKAFPFVPGSTISLNPILLDPEGPDDFRSPFEKLTQSEVIIFMFIQSNVTQALILWLPLIAPSTSVSSGTGFILGLIIYSITTAIAIVAVAYYLMMKIHLSPLRKTNLIYFRKLFILTSCFISSMFLIIISLVATKYPNFSIKFWITFATTGHALQACVTYLVYSWYRSRFSLELTGKEKTAQFLWFRFRTIENERNN